MRRIVCLLVLARAVTFQPTLAQESELPASEPDPPWTFQIGEQAIYDVTFGPVRVGRGRVTVEALDSLPTGVGHRVAFEIEGGPFFYKIDDRTVSWIATKPFRSLRFEQVLAEGGYRRHRRYELNQENHSFTREDWDAERDVYVPHETVRDVAMPVAALDEIGFLFLVRALPLQVGRTFRSERYFEADGNPVVVEVLRKERVRVSAGTFETFVVRPIIQTDGMFGEGGQAEVYVTDDERRVIVQVKTRINVGELNMYLKEFRAGRPGGG